ncbi:chord-domain-containing protein [Scleroderma citrinum]
MPRCTRKGCGKDYVVAENTDTSCVHHPGAPVFHEGLKSWSCCSTVNKPVLDFDEFMKIPGCAVGLHTEESLSIANKSPKPPAQVNITKTESRQEAEIYYTSIPGVTPKLTTAVPASSIELLPPDEDDLTVSVPPDTVCKRKSCGVMFVSDNENRIGDGPGTVCTYHPAPPIFREGSKGYLCCKRRVLEFEEFLKIEGCTKGRHIFVPKLQPSQKMTDQFADCRIDHYQTPREVHVSVFAKQADKELSSITIEETQVHLDLYLPGQRRFQRTVNLFGPVLPQESSYKFYGTKVEVQLKKSDTRSWTLLEKTNHSLGNINLTFGVGGRTGTIGGKEIILDEQNSSNWAP